MKSLDTYLGKDHPDMNSFTDIIPNHQNHLTYRKIVELCLTEKSRTIEIFMAFTLVFVIKFYKVSDDISRKESSESYIERFGLSTPNLYNVSERDVEA